jgi:hypothetical protein
MSDDRVYLRLLDEIETQGGKHLSTTCKSRKLDDLSRPMDPVYTQGCGQQRRVEIPDQIFATDTEDLKAGVTIACATDDRVDLWPRFAAIHKEDE